MELLFKGAILFLTNSRKSTNPFLKHQHWLKWKRLSVLNRAAEHAQEWLIHLAWTEERRRHSSISSATSNRREKTNKEAHVRQIDEGLCEKAAAREQFVSKIRLPRQIEQQKKGLDVDESWHSGQARREDVYTQHTVLSAVAGSKCVQAGKSILIFYVL